jgi:hypothetical protein
MVFSSVHLIYSWPPCAVYFFIFAKAHMLEEPNKSTSSPIKHQTSHAPFSPPPYIPTIKLMMEAFEESMEKHGEVGEGSKHASKNHVPLQDASYMSPSFSTFSTTCFSP